ncbi:MAG: tyrosine-type recombinase/integrase [Acidobacteria bacterium]|nr:tyrosine-type recombinase/integrase [Acidobacteriota bacterium]
MKTRVQHPKVHERKDRRGAYWFFRAWVDEPQPGGTVKTVRKFFTIGPSKGERAITKKEAEIERDKILLKLNTPTVREALAKGPALLSEVARMYKESYLSRVDQISKPTRAKEESHLDLYIIPKWGAYRLNEITPKEVEDWLYEALDSWWMRHAVRFVMGRLYRKAEEWGLWEEGKRSPIDKVKIGKKWYKRPRRILTMEQTARVLGRLQDPILLVMETCIATGARISEILGLQWKHVDLNAGTIRIEQRLWHLDIGEPKTETSKRTLALGTLVERFKQRAADQVPTPEAWVFGQKWDASKPLWDSSVRVALHEAAQAEGCDFEGLGPHSFRRANITWRQQVGASAIEASRIAGHADVDMTADYTFVDIERQQELTRAIQERLAKASGNNGQPARQPNPTPEVPPTPATPQNQNPPLEQMPCASTLVN